MSLARKRLSVAFLTGPFGINLAQCSLKVRRAQTWIGNDVGETTFH